jgi:hypothetical protein
MSDAQLFWLLAQVKRYHQLDFLASSKAFFAEWIRFLRATYLSYFGLAPHVIVIKRNAPTARTAIVIGEVSETCPALAGCGITLARVTTGTSAPRPKPV